MPTFRYIPDDWSTMKQAVYDWARAVVDSSVIVYWARQDSPSPSPPRVVLGLVVPPVGAGHSEHRSPGDALIIETVADAFSYEVTIGGTLVTFVSGASATFASIQAGLVSAINLAVSSVVASPFRDDEQILLAPTGASSPVLSLDNPGSNMVLKTVVQYYGNRVATFSVDVMTDPDVEDAAPIKSLLRGSLEGEVSRDILVTGGWAPLTVEGTRSPDIVVGAKWQDRDGFDLRLGCRERVTESTIDYIETVEVTDKIGSGSTSSIGVQP